MWRVLLVFIALSETAVAQSMPKEECFEKAAKTQALGALFSEIAEGLAVDFGYIYAGQNEPLKAARDAAQQAERAFTEAAVEYQRALQDLTYQLQLCSR